MMFIHPLEHVFALQDALCRLNILIRCHL